MSGSERPRAAESPGALPSIRRDGDDSTVFEIGGSGPGSGPGSANHPGHEASEAQGGAHQRELFGPGGSGATGVEASSSIGRLALKPKARLANPLTYEKVWSALRPRALEAKRDGATAELRILLLPDGRAPGVEHEADVLCVVAGRISSGGTIGGSSPLAVALIEEQTARALTYVWQDVAKGFVAAWRLDLPEPPPAPDFDTAGRAELLAFFERPRPVATLHVTMTDPAWLDHLTPFEPYDLAGHSTCSPSPWTDPPRTWKR